MSFAEKIAAAQAKPRQAKLQQALAGQTINDTAPDQATSGQAGVTENIRVQLTGGSLAKAWDAFVLAHEQGTFFHRLGWAEVIERTYGYKPLYLIAIDQTKEHLQPETKGVVGILPLTHVKSPFFGNSLISTAFTVGGGLLAESEAAALALTSYAQAMPELKRAQYLELRGASHDLSDWHKKSATYAGFVKEFTTDPDENLMAIPRKKRADIRKGIKALAEGKLTVNAQADISEVYALYAESVRNLGTPVFPLSLLKNLVDIFGDEIELSVISTGETAVAGLVSFYYKDCVMPYYGGAKPAARGVHAYDLMYWEQLGRAVKRGTTRFDFGRSKVGTGAFDYKKYWGFEPSPLEYFYHLSTASELPDINPNNPKFQLVTKAWQKLPLPIANMIGPILAKNLA